jgi:hypothetical protein
VTCISNELDESEACVLRESDSSDLYYTEERGVSGKVVCLVQVRLIGRMNWQV